MSRVPQDPRVFGPRSVHPPTRDDALAVLRFLHDETDISFREIVRSLWDEVHEARCAQAAMKDARACP